MKLAATLSSIKPEMDQVERKIKEITSAEPSMISHTSSHLLEAGGKRIRPVFVLLASKFGAPMQKNVIEVAIALELIHMASLVHDDVIDRATIRRGKPTVNDLWDNGTAMFTGDFIFARAVELLQNLDEPRLHLVLSHTIHQLTLGEIEQLKDRYMIGQNLFRYFRRIKRKTALLIASSTELGAISSQCNDEEIKQLKRFGYYIGMAYQIIDDILDFTASEKELGKPVGSDLLNGHLTLPTILAIQKDEASLSSIEAYFKDPTAYNREQIIQTIQDIGSSSAIDEAYAWSDAYLDRALIALEKLPSHPIKKTLRKIAIYLGKRKY
ncbi:MULTISPECIES: polyprenyl synthetase family protein [Allobacillus]|uniref:Heptaprenyl diphosphate synthase n=1 Tax=Allobacillus salarius TaxID=1955272 RepID=A0A556PT62_9BACI|nr:polyprenyl synthetase family protein [Allobacillus salarius]TSJ67564.1 heptaprenyl diphosphate synthase [Allobacillus salarius]